MNRRSPVLHHAWGCSCDSRECRRARNNQRSFDRFLVVVFVALYLAGIYAVIRAGLFAWLMN